MSLIKILGLKKSGEKSKFIDENLTTEEISTKISKMNLKEAYAYTSKLSENKKSLKEYCKNIEEKYDLEKH